MFKWKVIAEAVKSRRAAANHDSAFCKGSRHLTDFSKNVPSLRDAIFLYRDHPNAGMFSTFVTANQASHYGGMLPNFIDNSLDHS